MARKRATPRAAPAPPTIVSVVVEPVVQNVLVTVTTTATTTALYLGRTSPSGSGAGVRGAHPMVVSGAGTHLIRDFEVPLGVPLSYVATAANAAGESSASAPFVVTVPDSGCDDTWLTDLARPTNTQQIVIESLPELAHSIPAGVHFVLGRRAPIVSSDIANTPTFELSFLTDDDTSREQARATLGNGLPVLLRTTPELGIGNLYFGVTAFREQRIVSDGLQDDRRFAVSAVQVERPDPALYDPVPPSTYAQVKADHATYTALKTAYTSYDGMTYDYTGGEAADIVPWPATDV